MVPGGGLALSGARRGPLAVDRLTLLFVAALSAIVIARARRVGAWPWLLAAHALVVVLVALLRRAPGGTAFSRVVGVAYPLLLCGGFYTELGVMTLDTARVHDALVQRWEAALFGGQVSVTWHQRMPAPALSFLMHLGYGSYYLILVLVPLWLWLRTSRASFERGVFVMALAFYVCYVVFALFPVAGPRYFFGNATGPIAEVLPARLVRAVLEGGSAYGTAFPSSHVAAAWCAVLAAWKEARVLATVLAPLAVGLALGTVYGQFHYAVDALAGGALGLLVFALSGPVRRGLERCGPPGAPQ